MGKKIPLGSVKSSFYQSIGSGLSLVNSPAGPFVQDTVACSEIGLASTQIEGSAAGAHSICLVATRNCWEGRKWAGTTKTSSKQSANPPVVVRINRLAQEAIEYFRIKLKP